MFGLRWLLRRLNIYPNAYYNYRKHRKSDYYAHKAEVQAQIQEIYHSHNGVDGYRSMKVYVERKGYFYSSTTVHKYMNTELGLQSIVRPKKPGMNMANRIRYLTISSNKISLLTKSIRNGVLISLIFFLQIMKFATTVQSLICTTEA